MRFQKIDGFVNFLVYKNLQDLSVISSFYRMVNIVPENVLTKSYNFQNFCLYRFIFISLNPDRNSEK
jgi:hypothetical protein